VTCDPGEHVPPGEDARRQAVGRRPSKLIFNFQFQCYGAPVSAKKRRAESQEIPRPLSTPLTAAVAALCIIAFVLLVLGNMRATCATVDEPVHLLAGYSDVQWGDRRVNPEHPPLVKKLAALAILPLHPWPRSLSEPGSDAGNPSFRKLRGAFDRIPVDVANGVVAAHEFLYGFRSEVFARHDVEDSNLLPGEAAYAASDFQNDAARLLFSARLPIVAMGVLLALIIFFWSLELFGPAGALVSLAIFCFDPNFIAHSGLVTTDVPICSFVTGALYFLWRSLRRLTVPDALATAMFFSLALVSKYSAVLAIPIMLFLGLRQIARKQPWPTALPLALENRRTRTTVIIVFALCIAIISWAAVWSAYGFRYSAAAGAPGTAPRFDMDALLARDAAIEQVIETSHRFAGPQELAAVMASVDIGASRRVIRWAAQAHVLPEAFLYGFTWARLTSRYRAAFLRGEYADFGFPFYFAWTYLLKTPLMTMLLIALAFVVLLTRRHPGAAAFLLFPAVVWFVIALGSALDIGHRHLLPMYPFLFVACGSLAISWSALAPRRRLVFGVLVPALIVAGAFVVFSPPWRPRPVYPHHLSYFNELAGGPLNGYRSLVDSNLDWGQDLPALGQWLRDHRVSEPINFCYFGSADPRFYGIRHHNLFLGYEYERDEGFAAALPGLLAISATNLAGAAYDANARASWARFLSDTHAEKIGTAGYSIFIYRLSPTAKPVPK
jgi:hypothetical protein